VWFFGDVGSAILNICKTRRDVVLQNVLFRRVRKTANSSYQLFRVCVCPSAWNNSAVNGRIFMKFDTGFLENQSRKFKVL
jgi:hypothetical protein